MTTASAPPPLALDPAQIEGAEWLGVAASAGYLAYEPSTGKFWLTPACVPVLADEAGPAFFASFAQVAIALLPVFDSVLETVRSGRGVRFDELSEAYWINSARFTASWIDNLLVQAWLPRVPHLELRLRQGMRVADVGCGRGRALIALAQAFPESRFTGYDLNASNVDAATAAAVTAGVSDRVVFRQADIAGGLSGHCLSTALGRGGESPGAEGLPESRLRDVAAKAGFSTVNRVPIDHPINALYELGVSA